MNIKNIILFVTNSRILLLLLMFGIPFIFYFLTLAPTYLPPDGAEFTLCIQYLGICHPTGFFLYILLGKLFTLLFPFGSLMYKTNLLSALYAAGTVVFVYLSLLKMSVPKNLAALMALIFAFTSCLWEFAISADVFTFATFLLSLLIYVTLSGKMTASLFLAGLLTSHFPNSVILLPTLGWYFVKVKRLSLREMPQYILVFLLGSSPFVVLLFLRMQQHPLVNWDHVSNLKDFFDYLSRKEFGRFFLISTPNEFFTLTNFAEHLYLFTVTLLTQFGFILPIVACFSIIKGKLLRNDKVLLLILISGSLAVFNILSLSSINPFTQGMDMQFEKFYLQSFTVLTILIGVGLTKLKDYGIKTNYTLSLLGVILLSQLLINFHTHNYSTDHFSKNMTLDALDELPHNAIVITITNQNFFDAWYEQLNSDKYEQLTFVYLPNRNNVDFEKYHPELLFHRPIGSIGSRAGKTDNATYKSIFEIIARNPTRPIYLWQGGAEKDIIASGYLFKDILVPYGLWWKLEDTKDITLSNLMVSEKLLDNFRGKYIAIDGISKYQRDVDLPMYATACHSTGIALAKLGKYSDALKLLNRTLALSQDDTVVNEITAINAIEQLEPTTKILVSTRDETTLMHLATDYYILKDYRKMVGVYKEILTFDPQHAEIYSNLGTIYSFMNDKTNALIYFNKALQISPSLKLAIQGKKALEGMK